LKVLYSDARTANACGKISLVLRSTMQLYTGSYVSDNQIGAILALLSLRRLVTTDRQPGPIALIHGRFREPVIRNNLDQEIMIEGHCVPNSLAATTMPEPYRLAPPPRSMVGMLMDFGVAGVVAALVALFVTGELPIS
jgi:hypothetical protein